MYACTLVIYHTILVLAFNTMEFSAACENQQLLPKDTVRSEALKIRKIKKRDRTQRIFPDMHFSCSGLLTKWIIGGEEHANKKELPELQLWRPTDETTYSKINFSLISTLPSSTTHADVYEYILDPPLEFQAGDIFGVYKPKESESLLNIFLQENSGPLAYGKKDGVDMPLTEIMVDSTMLLDQNDYPMVSVEISTTSKGYIYILCIVSRLIRHVY